MEKSEISDTLTEQLRQNPVFAATVLAAIKLDDDVKVGLVSREFGDTNKLAAEFASQIDRNDGKSTDLSAEELAQVDLPVFLKQTLVALLKGALPEGKE